MHREVAYSCFFLPRAIIINGFHFHLPLLLPFHVIPIHTPFHIHYIFFFLFVFKVILKKKNPMMLIIGCGQCGKLSCVLFGHVECFVFHGAVRVFVHRSNYGLFLLYRGCGCAFAGFLPHGVDNLRAVKKVWKRGWIFCGRLYGNVGDKVVDWWITQRGFSGAGRGVCPQSFTRVFHKFCTGFSTGKKGRVGVWLRRRILLANLKGFSRRVFLPIFKKWGG